jgi:hypothetical protein
VLPIVREKRCGSEEIDAEGIRRRSVIRRECSQAIPGRLLAGVASRSHRAVTVAFMRFSRGVEQVQVDAPASLGRRVG